MAADNQLPPNGVSLREYVEAMIAAHDRRYEQRFLGQESAVTVALDRQEKAVNAALVAAATAVNKAEIAAEKRFESVNEFRAQLGDQAKTFMPRSEAEIRLTGLSEKIDKLAGDGRYAGGRLAGADATKALVFSLVAAVVAIAGIALALLR